MSSRHPCCLTCYEDRSEGRQPIPFTEGDIEECCFCGMDTWHGAWSESREKPKYCTAPDGDHGEG